MKKNVALFSLFFLLTLFFYRHTLSARFTYDFVTWITRWDDGFSGITKYFATDGLLPVYDSLMYGLYKLFGVNGFPWYLLCAFWHSLNAYLLFHLIRKMLVAVNDDKAYLLAAISSLLFLLSPYQAEAVIWGAAIHYLLSSTLMLGSILLTLNYAGNKNKWLLILIPLLFITGLFTLEAALVIPFMLLSLIWYSPASLIAPTDRRSLSLQVVLPQFLIVLLFFLVNKLVIGIYFGHYGGSPLQLIALPGIAGNYVKYLLKFVLFLPMFPFNFRGHIYDLIETPAVGWTLFFMMAAIMLFLFTRSFRFNNRGKLLFLLLLLFGLAMSLFSILPYRPIFQICNDRHGYLASMFFYPLLVLLAYSFLRQFGYALIALYLVLCVIFLVQFTGYWAIAGTTSEGLIKDFRWYDKDNIFVVSMPNRCNGAWIFETYGETFGQAVKVYTGKDIRSKVREISQFNIVSPHDSISVKVVSDTVLNIMGVVPGTWLWYHGRGLTSYDEKDEDNHDDYKVVCGQWSSDVIFKRKLPNSVYIYAVGGKWKEVKF